MSRAEVAEAALARVEAEMALPTVERVNEPDCEGGPWYVDDGVRVEFFADRDDAQAYADRCTLANIDRFMARRRAAEFDPIVGTVQARPDGTCELRGDYEYTHTAAELADAGAILLAAARAAEGEVS